MKPYVFSKKSYMLSKKDWHQAGENVTYRQRKALYERYIQ